MSKEFKAGDLVYYPLKSTKVLTVHEQNNPVYPIFVTNHAFTFTIDGKHLSTDTAPCLIPATPENHALLEQLHGIEFEEPPVKPTSREIIRAKLNKSTEPVPCWVSNNSDCTQPTCKNRWVFIEKDCIEDCDEEQFFDFPYRDSTGTHWKYATPFDPHTVEAITELPK